jgi:hypothetical protein
VFIIMLCPFLRVYKAEREDRVRQNVVQVPFGDPQHLGDVERSQPVSSAVVDVAATRGD